MVNAQGKRSAALGSLSKIFPALKGRHHGAGSVALSGLGNLVGGLPRASLADSLCPGLSMFRAFSPLNLHDLCVRRSISARATKLFLRAPEVIGRMRPRPRTPAT